MLHALLHNKLDESIPVSRRLEDAVTSSVFGALLMSNADHELRTWFDMATGPQADAASIDGNVVNAWFWPRLALAEPDLVIQFEDRVVVIEAKVGSDRHDLFTEREVDPEDWTTISNQLVRQWRCATALNPGPACPLDLASALRTLPVTLIFLVDERRLHRARLEFDDTIWQLPTDADIRLLTWQSLHRDLVRSASATNPSFSRDTLIAYLERAGLAGFVGFRGMSLPALKAAEAFDRLRWALPTRTGPSWVGMTFPTRSDIATFERLRWARPKRVAPSWVGMPSPARGVSTAFERFHWARPPRTGPRWAGMASINNPRSSAALLRWAGYSPRS